MKPLRIGIVAESTGLPVRSAVAQAAKMGAGGVQVDADDSRANQDVARWQAKSRLSWA